MMTRNSVSAVATAIFLALASGCEVDDGADGADGATGAAGAAGMPGAAGADTERQTIALRYLSSARNPAAGFDQSAAEIVAYDATTQRAYVVNAQSGAIDIYDLSAPATPQLSGSLDVANDVAAARTELADANALGAVNSVATSGGVVAVAIEAAPKQDPGYVAFFQISDGSFLSAVQVGALPDMLTFSPSGNVVLVANEGEPSADYSNDPEGSVSLIDVSAGVATLSDAQVTAIGFAAFNAGGARAAELGSEVRTPNPRGITSVAQDLEPEYITVSADNGTAWVAMQENNAIAEIDLASASITAIWGLGSKDHGLLGNEMDASNRDAAISLRNWPVRGLFMPDAIASYSYGGSNYLVTANEGDGREYIFDAADAATCTAAGGIAFDDGDCLAYLDEVRVKDIIEDYNASIDIDGIARFPGANDDSDSDGTPDIFENENLGRLKVVATEGADAGCDLSDGQPEAGCSYGTLFSFGARSFSIFNADTQRLVYDSGNDFERITAQRLGANFNASNDDNEGDDRSDDKGPEAEAVSLGVINGRTYAFIGLERVGGVMVYDISEPEFARFVQYINNRDFSADVQNPDDSYNPAAGDLGPESIVFVPAADSPNGSALLLVGNEVSGTLAIFQIEAITLAQ